MAAVALVFPVLPVLLAGPDAVAQEDVPEPAVWRALRQSWETDWAGGSNFTDIDFVSEEKGFAALGGSFPVLMTGDGAQTWAGVADDQQLGIVNALDFVAGNGVDIGVAVTDARRTISHAEHLPNGSTTWSKVVSQSTIEFGDVALVVGPDRDPDRTLAVAVGEDEKGTAAQGDDVPVILRSTDGGRTWSDNAEITLPDGVAPGDVTLDVNMGVALAPGREDPDDPDQMLGAVAGKASGQGLILVTTNGGRSWSPAHFGGPPLRDVALVRHGADVLGVAVGESPFQFVPPVTRSTVLRTVDGDVSKKWTSEDIRTPFDTVPNTSGSPLPHLASVALGEREGRPVGYIAVEPGQLGSVLEMRDDEGKQWDAAPIDARAYRPSGSSSSVPKLRSVTVSDSAAVVVGDAGMMAKRTPLNASGAEAVTGDEWWRCVDEGQVEEFENAGGQPVPGEAPVCEGLGDLTGTSTARNFGSTRAVECEPGEAEVPDEFPCVASWHQRDEGGDRAGSFGFDAGVDRLFFDGVDDDGDGENDGFGPDGRDRRVVAVGGRGPKTRVALFDPDRLEQRGVEGFGAGFAKPSAFGADTGVVRLGDALDGEGETVDIPADVSARAYDGVGHRVFLVNSVGCTGVAPCADVPPRIVTVSLTGDFEPAVTEIPAKVDGTRVNHTITHVVFDARHGVLYALTLTDPYLGLVFGFPPNTATTTHVSLYAFEVDPTTGTLVKAWDQPLPLDDRCRTTINLPGIVMSQAGDAIAFGCNGHSLPHFGAPTFEPHQIVTVELRLRGRHPRELSPANPVDVAVHSEAIGGRVFNESDVTFGLEGRGLLAWHFQGAATLWDAGSQGWIGAVALSTGSLRGGAADPGTGRLYVHCRSCLEDEDGVAAGSGLVVVDTLNLPVEDLAATVVPAPAFDSQKSSVLVPAREGKDRPRLFASDRHTDGIVNVYEDRVVPALPRRFPDPDVNTNDIPEEEAVSVKRTGQARGYGARLWWTGLATSLPGTCETNNVVAALQCPGEPSLTYEWLFDPTRDTVQSSGLPRHGEHTSRVPGRPGIGQRELRLGEVQRSNLEFNSSGRLSQGRAVSVFYDGGPADESGGNTGEDVKRRRGAGDAHDFADFEAGGAVDESEFTLCERRRSPPTSTSTTTTTTPEQKQCRDGHDDFREGHGQLDERVLGPFSVRFDEGVDRLMREVDGERRLEGGCSPEDDPKTEKDESDVDDPDTPWHEGDCFSEFDRDDPRRDERTPTPLRDRRGVEERAGATYASECLEPGEKNIQSRGSRVRCDRSEGMTEAAAELGGFSLVPSEEGASTGLSVGATGSSTRSFVDADEGVVVEVSSSAADVVLRVPGEATLSIGEVRTTARARAKGRPGSAGSWVDVAYEDVTVTGPAGDVRFACGRADPDAGPPSVDATDPAPPGDDPNGDGNDRDGDGESDGPDQDDAVFAAGLAPDDRTSREGQAAACDPQRVVDVFNRLVTGKVQATTSAPDTDPETRGSDGGAQAIVQRDPTEIISDQVVNRIEGLRSLPGLQLTIYNDGVRPNRVQVDLAAVYAETHYEIGERFTERTVSPGEVAVELSDPAGAPLSGGEFTLFEDSDGDGALGSSDVAVRSCTTDASGGCRFGEVDAGGYVVEQARAPMGFLRTERPVSVFVSEGASETASFVNAPNSAAVVVELVDPAGRPLAGGEFGLARDPGGDGLDPTDRVAVSCVTGGDGLCRFDGLALGGWVLHQSAAPRAYEATDDVAFALARPGQVARIRVVNGTGVAAAGVRIIEIIDGAQPTSNTDGGDAPWWALLPRSLGAFLQRGWLEALLFGLTGMLFGAPAYLAHRRRELGLVRQRR